MCLEWCKSLFWSGSYAPLSNEEKWENESWASWDEDAEHIEWGTHGVKETGEAEVELDPGGNYRKFDEPEVEVGIPMSSDVENVVVNGTEKPISVYHVEPDSETTSPPLIEMPPQAAEGMQSSVLREIEESGSSSSIVSQPQLIETLQRNSDLVDMIESSDNENEQQNVFENFANRDNEQHDESGDINEQHQLFEEITNHNKEQHDEIEAFANHNKEQHQLFEEITNHNNEQRNEIVESTDNNVGEYNPQSQGRKGATQDDFLQRLEREREDEESDISDRVKEQRKLFEELGMTPSPAVALSSKPSSMLNSFTPSKVAEEPVYDSFSIERGNDTLDSFMMDDNWGDDEIDLENVED